MNGIHGSQKSESALDASQHTGTGQKKKKCTKCGERKQSAEFSKNKKTKDGLCYWCRACARDAYQKWAKENAEKIKEKDRKWAKANPEKVREKARRRRAVDAKRINKVLQEWMKANPEKATVINRNKKVKRKKAEGRHTEKDIQEIFDRQGGQCNACGKKLIRYRKKKYHVDHIIPIAKKGTNWPENIQLLCPECNASKHAKDPIKWARENGRLF